MEHTSLKDWHDDDRPREKMLKHGTSSLTDTELLAILLRTGTREETVVELSRRILASVGNNLDELGKLSVGTLQKNFKGVGETKAITLIAAMELGKRRRHEMAKRSQILSSRDAYDYFQPLMADLPHEEFWVMTLNRRNCVIDAVCVSKGGVNATVADIRLILRHAIERLASGIILCHNHPSGHSEPSKIDGELTRRVREACSLFDISLHDHIVVAESNYYSFADTGNLY